MTKWVYSFGGGAAEGRAEMRNLLGGKGANLAEMSNLGAAGAARLHHHDRGLHLFLRQRQILSARPRSPGRRRRWPRSSARSARSFGDADNPLLVSVRSGARASMPGMMDTVLNLGLNDRDGRGPGAAERRRALRL